MRVLLVSLFILLKKNLILLNVFGFYINKEEFLIK
jgi:hypothetical protein